jgi:hypothetical protein
MLAARYYCHLASTVSIEPIASTASIETIASKNIKIHEIHPTLIYNCSAAI